MYKQKLIAYKAKFKSRISNLLPEIFNGTIIGAFSSIFLHGTLFLVRHLENLFPSDYQPQEGTVSLIAGLLSFLFFCTLRSNSFVKKTAGLLAFYFTGIYFGFVFSHSEPQIAIDFLNINFIGTLLYFVYICFLELKKSQKITN